MLPAGTAGSHWEFRLFSGDIMCGVLPGSSYGKKSQISALTMAWVEDTGAWGRAVCVCVGGSGDGRVMEGGIWLQTRRRSTREM